MSSDGKFGTYHTRLRPRQKPKHTLDNKIGHEPPHSRLRNSMVYICCFEEICYQAVDGKTAFEDLAEDFEAAQGFREGKETGAEAHRH